MAFDPCVELLGGRVVPMKNNIDWTPGGEVMNKEALKQYFVAPEDIGKYNNAMSFTSKEGKQALTRMGVTRDEVYDRVTEARSKILATASSVSKYYDEAAGVYQAERTKLHQSIVSDIVKRGAVAEKPTVLITGGIPGSGKSTMLGHDIYKDRLKSYAILDSDNIKGVLAKADGIDKVTWQAGTYHVESSDVLNIAFRQAVAEKRNIVLDMTMKNTGKTAAMIDELKAAGYKVEIAYAELPLEKAIVRGVERFVKDQGRFVDPVYIASNGDKTLKTFEAVKEKADVWRQWNTDVPFGKLAKIVDEGKN
jgi:predicted ABC-type ATPase